MFSSVSVRWSLMKDFLSFPAILWNSAFRWVYLSFSPLLYFLISLLFSAICKASSENHFTSFFFFAYLFLSNVLDHCLLDKVTNLISYEDIILQNVKTALVGQYQYKKKKIKKWGDLNGHYSKEDIQMVMIHMKRWSTWLLEKCTSELQWGITSHQSK